MRAALLIACWAAFSVPVALVIAAGIRSARGVELAEELELYLLGVEPSDDDVGECSADWRDGS